MLHQFIQGGICLYNPESASLPTNSSLNHYKLTEEAWNACRKFGSPRWTQARDAFLAVAGSLSEKYSTARDLEQVPVTLPGGRKVLLSPGIHNTLQAAIVMEFAPRFSPGAVVLYLGDSTHKALVYREKEMKEIGILITQHDKMPDVVLLDKKRGWLFLVEAVTSHGPMSPKRIIELRKLLEKCKIGPVFVSAFPSIAEFKKHATDIAWDTEVWLSDVPDHMMHFNGDRFLGPR